MMNSDAIDVYNIVKKLHSLKRFVRTVAASQHIKKGDIT